MLAPFLTPDAVRSIVGRDMFADPDQIRGFAALMSNDDKPFECVGERRESAAAMRILSERPEWKDTVVVASLADRARAMVSDDDVRALLTAQPGLRFARPEVADGVDRLLMEVA